MAKRQAGDHAGLLLKIQRDQLAVVLLGQALRLLYVQGELLFVIRRVHHQEGDQEHPFISALEVFQQFFCLTAVGGQVAGNDIHVITGTDSLFLFFDLHLVQVGDLAFHVFDGCNLVDGLDMKGDDEAGFHGEKVGQAPVIEIRGEDGEKADLALFAAHAEAVLGPEIKAGRCDKVLGGQTGRRKPFPVELEGRLRIHVKHVMHQLEPFPSVQGCCGNAQTLEVVEQIDFDPLQARLCRFVLFRLDAVGNKLGLGQAIVSFGQLVLEHFGILVPDLVEPVVPVRDDDTLFKGFRAGRQVQERKLKMNGGIKIIEEITPAFKDRGFIVVLRQLVVDILKLDGFGIVVIRHPADAVRPHPLVGDGILSGVRTFLILLLVALHQGLQLLFLSPGQLDFFFCFFTM